MRKGVTKREKVTGVAVVLLSVAAIFGNPRAEIPETVEASAVIAVDHSKRQDAIEERLKRYDERFPRQHGFVGMEIADVEYEVEMERIEQREAVEKRNEQVPSGCLTASRGVFAGPSGKETWYNLPMGGIVQIMRGMGFNDEDFPYWTREDGVKMLGPYVMVAANLELRPRGSLVETSLGTGIVCDTGGFAAVDQTQIDIATNW